MCMAVWSVVLGLRRRYGGGALGEPGHQLGDISGSKPDETNHIQGYVEKGLAIDRRMYLYRI